MEGQRSEDASATIIIDESNVTPIFGRTRCKREQPPATDEELAEYRLMRPLLLQMLKEWPTYKAAFDRLNNKDEGCPVMWHVLNHHV